MAMPVSPEGSEDAQRRAALVIRDIGSAPTVQDCARQVAPALRQLMASVPGNPGDLIRNGADPDTWYVVLAWALNMSKLALWIDGTPYQSPLDAMEERGQAPTELLQVGEAIVQGCQLIAQRAFPRRDSTDRTTLWAIGQVMLWHVYYDRAPSDRDLERAVPSLWGTMVHRGSIRPVASEAASVDDHIHALRWTRQWQDFIGRERPAVPGGHPTGSVSDDPELVELRNYVANLKARGVSRTEALEDAKAFVQKQSWYTASLSLIPKEQRTFKHQRYRNHYAKAMKRVKDALDRLY